MGVKFYHARSWELTNKGQIEVPKSPLCSVGICWPKILVNAAWFMEWWEGKPQREWVFHVLIPRGVPICNGRAGVFSSWYQVGGLTAPWLLKHLGTGSLEHSPDETELKTSVQNVLRHLYHAFTLMAALRFWHIFFIHSSSSQSCIAIFYGTEYLWGRKIKNTVVLRAVLFSRWCSVQDEVNAWDKDLSTFWRKRGIVISFVLWPQRAEGVRLRCPQGVLLGQGICERLQEEQSELFLREEGEWAWDRSHYGVHTMVCCP